MQPRRTGNYFDELAPPHSITSSAQESIIHPTSYSGSRDTPGSNLRCNCSASERVSTIVWNAPATLCERLSDALGIGFLARAFLPTDLDFFGATVLRRFFAIVPFLLEVFAFLFAFEAVLLRIFVAIVDPRVVQDCTQSIGGA
jgi:hypothetical protein